MSDAPSPPGADAGRDGEREQSSGEELLEREERLQQEERVRRERPGGEEPTGDAEEEAAEDAEEVESEWHVWILALVVVAGIALFFAPRFFLPELLGSLGLLLVAIGALGLFVRWAIERSG